MLNETSKHSTKLRSKIRYTKRNIVRNFTRCFEHVKTIALRNFFEISSKFRFLRNITSFRLHSSKFALIIFSQYCKGDRHFKELEYQQPVLVTSGVLKTILCLLLPIDSYVVVQILDTGTTCKTWQLRG